MTMTALGNLTGSGSGIAYASGDLPTLSNLYKQVYADLIRLQVQQFDSVLSDTLQNETIEGEVKSFDKLLRHTVSQLQTRDRYVEWGTTGNEYTPTGSERRLVEPAWFEYAELFDPRDEVGLLRAIAPDGQYLANIAAIFNQKKDLLILDGLAGVVLKQTRSGNGITANTETAYGTTTTGSFKADTTSPEFPLVAYGAYEGMEIGCKLASGAPTDKTPLVEFTAGDTDDDTGTVKIAGAAALTLKAVTATVQTEIETDSAAVTGFNVEKLVRARQALDAANALVPGMPYVCVMHPNQFYDLMSQSSDTRFTSIDFNEGKPLYSGTAFVYMGFEFRLSTVVPQVTIDLPNGEADTTISGVDTFNVGTATNAVRYAYFYSPMAGIFGSNDQMQIRFDEIPERGYSLQVWHQMGMNAVRMDGDCVVRVACLDSSAI